MTPHPADRLPAAPDSRPFIVRCDRIYPRPAAGAEAWVEALAIGEGRILAAGSLVDAWSAVGSDVDLIDLGAASVVPGFIDAHIHVGKYALARQQLRLADADRLETVLAAVADQVARRPVGSWIVGRGWDHSDWGRWPNAADLDRVSPAHPVALTRKDGHVLWLNSLAMDAAGILAAEQAPPGGEVVMEDGRPSGILKENAQRLARSAIPEPDAATRQAALEAAWPALWRHGITGCHDMGFRGMDLWDDLQAMRSQGRLGLRVVWYALDGAFDEALERGLDAERGDAWLRMGGLKLFLDGTLGSQTAELLAPYVAQPDNRGLATLEFDAFCERVSLAASRGLPTAVHAIGDGASRKALDGFARVAARTAVGSAALRQRIEHAQLLHPDDIPRFGTEGVIASMQPIHLAADWPVADRFWADRKAHAYVWRELASRGARLAFGSDAPIESVDVLQGLRCAVTRQDRDGRPAGGWCPEQRLDRWSALAAYGVGAAHAAGQEAELGTLMPGCRADLVVLDGDLAALPDPKLGELEARATMIEGRWVWQREG